MIILENNIDSITDYLKQRSWLMKDELPESIEVPGEGNMNFTLRVKTNKRSFIMKQSRGYVEKYPQVSAPANRSMREATFYNIISDDRDLSDRTPTLLNVDRNDNVIMMSDLGKGNDFTSLYGSNTKLKDETLKEIINFIITLHTKFRKENVKDYIQNTEMRKLNHEHMFIYPFQEKNGLDLDEVLPGLADVARPYQHDDELKIIMHKLGEKYLEDGNTLLHGDYFMGSWLMTDVGIKIIDPEFCFFGFPEFEVGIMIGHLMMADMPQETVEYAIDYYANNAPLDRVLCMKYASSEIMRRIIGLAQLPLAIDIEKRKTLLRLANNILKNKR